MLELKNVSKIYKTKSQDVKALDKVNLYFEETGMVFVTGKSGSGKTTLLNVIGGLDNFNEGEILIKGKSSISFTGSDFDSYRNTYVGFVFQEYNLLDEMTIGQNLGLALKLQGKHCSNEEVTRILKAVDLHDVSTRFPQELSGGQRQRVAIARALIKDPSIIMADEPTGALDTENGQQIMELLKELSKNKLVIVVSHDLELADKFADRIIRMQDGKVDSDYTIEATEQNVANVYESSQSVSIKRKAELKDDDLSIIKKAVKKGKDVVVADNISTIKKETNIVDKKTYDGKQTFIKTKLGFKDTLVLGLNALKTKRLRLAITIILCVFAFTIFGVFDSLSIYNENRMVENALKYSTSPSVVMTAGVKDENKHEYDINASQKLVDDLASSTGYDVKGIYSAYYVGTSAPQEINNNNAYQISRYFSYRSLRGVVEFSKDDLANYKFSMAAGRLPVNFEEIAVSKYFACCLINLWYSYQDENNDVIPLINISQDVASQIDIDNDSPLYVDEITNRVIAILKSQIEQGKALYLTIGTQDYKTSYKIVGIVDTGAIDSKFDSLKVNFDESSTTDTNEFRNYITNSYHLYAFVKEGFVKNALWQANTLTRYDNNQAYSFPFTSADGQTTSNENYFYRFEDLKNLTSNYYFLEEGKTELAQNEFLADISLFPVWYANSINELLEKADQDSSFRTEADNIRVYLSTLTDSKSSIGDKMTALVTAIEKLNEMQALLHSISPEQEPADTCILPLDFTVKKKDKNTFIEGTTVSVEIPLENDSYKLVGFYMGVNVPNTNIVSLMLTDDGMKNLGIRMEQGEYSSLIATNIGQGKASALTSVFLGDNEIQYSCQNNAILLIELNSDFFAKLSQLFWIASGIFAVFSIVMLWNFIATSIKNKYGEIGILRALGARGFDIMKMFVAETVVIALINAACACVLTWGGTYLVNLYLSKNLNLYIPIANFGIRQILITLAFSLVVGIVSTIIPIAMVSKQKPVETIRKSF